MSFKSYLEIHCNFELKVTARNLDSTLAAIDDYVFPSWVPLTIPDQFRNNHPDIKRIYRLHDDFSTYNNAILKLEYKNEIISIQDIAANDGSIMESIDYNAAAKSFIFNINSKRYPYEYSAGIISLYDFLSEEEVNTLKAFFDLHPIPNPLVPDNALLVWEQFKDEVKKGNKVDVVHGYSNFIMQQCFNFSETAACDFLMFHGFRCDEPPPIDDI